MTAITAITAQSTVGVDAVGAIDPEMIVAQVRAVARDIGVDAVKIGMLGDRRDDRGRRAGARRAGPRHADRARPRDGRRVRRASCSTPDARAALVERLLPRVDRRDAEPAGGARARRRRPRARDATRRARARDPCARPALRRRHRRPPRAGGRRLLRRRDARRDPRRALPRRRRARLRLHALLRARGAPRARLHAAGGRARREGARRARRCATGCARSARGAGPVDVLGSPRRAPTRRTAVRTHNPLP